jgi:hypothetical protein
MLDQLALSIVFGIIGRSVTILAEHGVRNVINLSRFSQKQNYLNHDLEKGLYRAYILAILNICKECNLTLKESGDSFLKERNWLEEKQRRLSSDLDAIEYENLTGGLSLSLSDIGTLLIPDTLSNAKYIQAVQDKLVEFTLMEETPSPCFKEKIKESLIDEVSLYFAFQIKSNDKLRHIFSVQVLSQLGFHIEDLERSIQELSKEYPSLQKKLDVIQTELLSTRAQLDSQHKEILGVLTDSSSDLAEIKTHLKILRNQFSTDADQANSGSNALFYITKDDIQTKRVIHLKTDQEIFIIGRKTEGSHPYISLGSLFVGREHAFIENRNSVFFITDKGSKNGTNINGMPLEKGKAYRLNHGDQIGLAKNHVICYFCYRFYSPETMELS